MSNLIIKASAGTGKTYQLSRRYLQLLLSGERPESILATTFTKKAAGEIQSRILSWLAAGAVNEKSAQELADRLQDDSFTVPLTVQSIQAALYNTLKNLNRLNISTLDSFFNQRAQCFALELGLPIEWKIIEQDEDNRIRQKVVSTMLSDKSLAQKFTQLLPKGELRRAVHDYLLTNINRLYSLWKESPDSAWDALKIPPFNASEAEIIDSIQSVVDCIDQETEITVSQKGKIKSSLEKLLIDFPVLNNIIYFQTHADGTRFWEASKNPEGGICYQKRSIQNKQTETNLYQIVRYLESFIKTLWRERTDFFREAVAQFDALYMREKCNSGQMIFADIPSLLSSETFIARQLDPSFRMDGSIRHLMLDEFQDTSLEQWAVLQPLAKQTTASNRSFFCVGDDKQAIYGWRGGEAELLNSMQSLLTPAQIEIRQMNDSRRSGTAIMETVNDTFQNLPDNKAIVSDSKKDDQPQPLVSAATSWYHRFQTHQTVQKFHSYAELRTVPYIQENSEESDQSESSDSENADQLRQMVYQYTAEQVKSMYEQTKPMNFSIGVLTRSNEAACSIAELIKKQGLECSLEGKSPLLDSSSVVLILALLGWIDHPGNSQAAYQVCHSPLVHFLGWDNQPLFDNNGLPAIPANSNEKLQRLRLDIMNKGYGAVIEQWANYLSAQSSDRNRRRLDSLIEMAYAYNEKITCRTDDFIAYIQSHAVQDLINCRIRVMTYHQSKGLEFDIVILPELNKALFNTNDEIVVSGRPSPTEPWNQIIRSVKQEYRYLLPAAQQNLFVQRDERLMQEALCNLYVALTRAARGLYMYLTPPKQNGKSANAKQYADVLMGSLAPGSKLAEDTIYYQKGDSNWIENTFTEFQNKETAGKKADKTTSPNAPENIILSSKCEFHSDASKRNYFVPITASGWKLEEGESTQFIELISVNQDSGVLESLSPSHRGSLFHKWLEDVRWLKDYQFDASHLIELGISLGFQSAEFENYIPLFKQLLQRQELQSILNPPDNDWSVYREKAVGAHIPQKGKPHTFWLLNGAIDRLMLCQSEGIISQAVILDYKTVPAGFNASALKKKYSGQMDAYRQMVCQTYHLPVEKVKNQLLVIEV